VSVEIWPAPVESQMARRLIARTVYIGPPLILIFGLLRGWEGAWAAALGVAIVVANFWLYGVIMSISLKIGLHAYHAAALIGFFLRLGIFVGAVYLIASLVEVDRLAFGISAVVCYLALLVLEALAVSRRGKESKWTL
jgi:hypothetical protein